jgi:hypothetical protein
MQTTVGSGNDRAAMRGSAVRCLLLGVVSVMVGAGLCGYVAVAWTGTLSGALTWLPVGGGLVSVGLALVLLGFLAPRDRRAG